MKDVITPQDHFASEKYATSRAGKFSKVWLECREAWLAALKEERLPNLPPITPPERIAVKNDISPFEHELVSETWGAP